MAELIAKGQRSLKRHLDFSYIDEDFGILSEMRSTRISLRGSTVAKRLLVRRCNYHSERVLETTAEADEERRLGKTSTGAETAQNGDMERNGQHQQERPSSSEGYVLDLEWEKNVHSNELAELDIVRDDFCPLAAYNVPKHFAKAPTADEMGRAKAALMQALNESGSVLEEMNQIIFFDLLTAQHLDDFDEATERAETDTAVAVSFKELSKSDVEQIRTVHACRLWKNAFSTNNRKMPF
uniref:Uncharacterized protein n=1 Tax=Globodera rostochiensis TaxID=31243 RepID=A0A914H0W8_GLORO